MSEKPADGTGPLSPVALIGRGTGPLRLGPSADTAAPETPSIWRSQNFVFAWLAHTTSQLGDRVHQLALTWWTLATTGSLAYTGAMLIATSLPAVLLGPVAGAAIDRFPRKPLMVATDLLRALLVGVLAYLTWQGQLTIATALVLSAAIAACTAFFTPAALAIVPTLVGKADVLRATSLMEASVQGASVGGPVLGGLVVAAVGAGGAFGVNSLSFLFSALCLLLVAIPVQAAASAGESFVAAMGGGFRLLKRMPTITGVLACFAVSNVFTMPVILYLPYFAKDVFKVGATGLGWMEAALGLGMLAAALFWTAKGEATRRFPVVAGGLGFTGLAIATMGLWPIFPVHVVALVVAGLATGSLNVVTIAWFQAKVPPEEAGRFFALLTSLCSGLVPLSFGVYGALAGVLDPAWLLVFNAGAIAVITVALAFVPGFRRE